MVVCNPQNVHPSGRIIGQGRINKRQPWSGMARMSRSQRGYQTAVFGVWIIHQRADIQIVARRGFLHMDHGRAIFLVLNPDSSHARHRFTLQFV